MVILCYINFECYDILDGLWSDEIYYEIFLIRNVLYLEMYIII